MKAIIELNGDDLSLEEFYPLGATDEETALIEKVIRERFKKRDQKNG